MSDDRRDPDTMSEEECRAEVEELERAIGTHGPSHSRWDGNIHYWRGRVDCARDLFDQVPDPLRNAIATLRARVADLERERDTLHGRITSLAETWEVLIQQCVDGEMSDEAFLAHAARMGEDVRGLLTPADAAEGEDT